MNYLTRSLNEIENPYLFKVVFQSEKIKFHFSERVIINLVAKTCLSSTNVISGND